MFHKKFKSLNTFNLLITEKVLLHGTNHQENKPNNQNEKEYPLDTNALRERLSFSHFEREIVKKLKISIVYFSMKY